MISSTTSYSSATFIRSHIAKLSYDALLTLYKNSPTPLAQYLVNLGALNETIAVAIKVIGNPAIINGKLYALKDSSFYDIGENDCYVDVLASASISNSKKTDVYIHKNNSIKESHSLLNIPISGYSRLVFRIVHENAETSNMVHILDSLEDVYVTDTIYAVKKFLSENIEEGTPVLGAQCSACKSTNIVYTGGCSLCQDCGASGCG
jgi:hypothetical protein